MAIINDFEELDIYTMDEQNQLITEALELVEAENYIGSHPPKRAYS
ncbi:MAG: hypothetical protein LWY06_18680 [Firmicutes bacterium]|nr:hypothetical protein [Bacillota bacterium]